MEKEVRRDWEMRVGMAVSIGVWYAVQGSSRRARRRFAPDAEMAYACRHIGEVDSCRRG